MPLLKEGGKKEIASFFLTIFLLSSFLVPLQSYAQTGVPVDKSFFDKAKDVAILVEETATTIESTLIKTFTDWTTFKAKILDPLAKQILITLIRTMKQMAINYIVTGEAGEPKFITNFHVDIKKSLENATRSYLSRLTGINFCSFFPPVQPLLIPLSFEFQLQCAVNSSLYNQYIRDPASVSEIERILATDPSTDFLQVLISAGQQKAYQLAEAGIARAAEVSAGNGLLGDSEEIITNTDRATANEATRQNAERVRQEAIGESIRNGNSVETARQDGDISYNAALQDPVPAKTTRRIKTPGAAVSGLLKDALGSDWLYPAVADEFDQAVMQIVDVAFGQMINKGLDEIFK